MSEMIRGRSYHTSQGEQGLVIPEPPLGEGASDLAKQSTEPERACVPANGPPRKACVAELAAGLHGLARAEQPRKSALAQYAHTQKAASALLPQGTV